VPCIEYEFFRGLGQGWMNIGRLWKKRSVKSSRVESCGFRPFAENAMDGAPAFSARLRQKSKEGRASR